MPGAGWQNAGTAAVAACERLAAARAAASGTPRCSMVTKIATDLSRSWKDNGNALLNSTCLVGKCVRISYSRTAPSGACIPSS